MEPSIYSVGNGGSYPYMVINRHIVIEIFKLYDGRCNQLHQEYEDLPIFSFKDATLISVSVDVKDDEYEEDMYRMFGDRVLISLNNGKCVFIDYHIVEFRPTSPIIKIISQEKDRIVTTIGIDTLNNVYNLSDTPITVDKIQALSEFYVDNDFENIYTYDNLKEKIILHS